MHLKLIGSDCSNGIKIIKNIKKAEKDLKMKINVEEVPISLKEKYNIKVVPTLIIDGKKVFEGFVPTEKELIRKLKEINV